MKKNKKPFNNKLILIIIPVIFLSLFAIIYKKSTYNKNYSENHGLRYSQFSEKNINKKVFDGSFFSFEYPDNFYHNNTYLKYSTENQYSLIEFFKSKEVAKEAEECVENDLGTMEKLCNEFQAFSIDVSKNNKPYELSLKNASNTNQELITTWKESNGRTWIIEGPVNNNSFLSFRAELEDQNFIYQVSISSGLLYNDNSITAESHLNLSKEILSTFKIK